MAKRLGILTQDPANRGGVLRLVRYIYERAVATGLEPIVLHYASFKKWPLLSTSFVRPTEILNPFKTPILKSPQKREYEFEGMQAVAIGANFPEFEPQRIGANDLWKEEIARCEAVIVVTGSAHIGAVMTQLHLPFAAWVSSTIDDDRTVRLANDRSMPAMLEKATLAKVRADELTVLQNAAPLIAVSHDTAGSIVARDERLAPEVWPYPIDTDLYTVSEAPRARRVLFVGRASDPRKNFRLFLDAFAELRKLDPTIAADVVSSRPDTRELSQYEEIHKSITYHVGITDAELRKLYHTASVLIVTSEQEGLHIAALEAMACGMPVITTRCGGPEMFVKDSINGSVTDSDPNETARAAFKLLGDPVALREYGRNARKTIEADFSRAQWNARFEAMLLSIIQ